MLHAQTRCKSVHVLGFTAGQKKCGKSWKIRTGPRAAYPPSQPFLGSVRPSPTREKTAAKGAKDKQLPAQKYKILVPTPPSFTMRAHTFDVLICSNILLICSNSFWKFAASISNLQQLYFICSNFILFAATFFNFQQLYFYLQQVFNLQHVPCGPPYYKCQSCTLQSLPDTFW